MVSIEVIRSVREDVDNRHRKRSIDAGERTTWDERFVGTRKSRASIRTSFSVGAGLQKKKRSLLLELTRVFLLHRKSESCISRFGS